VTNDPLTRPEFWYEWFNTFGAIGDPIDESTLSKAFGVTSNEALEWSRAFTGWYDEVFDEADGQVDNPAVILIDVSGGVSLRAEVHPGDIYFHLKDEFTDLEVGNIGPHWALPFISLSEAVALSNNLRSAEPEVRSRAFLFFAIGIWLHESEADAARDVFIQQCLTSGVVEPTAAEELAGAWIEAVTDDAYAFYDHENIGIVTTSPWSRRNLEKNSSTARAVASLLRKAGA
jgi:hypothetical protein